MSESPVLIVGAGLSGLACALELSNRQVPFRIFEASDTVGGRIRTDIVDGFRLDRGFQVFLTSYSEASRVLDYEALDLKKFKSGALVRTNNSFCRITDVVRHPADLAGNIFSKAGSLSDKLKLASLRSNVGNMSLSEIEFLDNISTKERLLQFGFSQKIIDSFFRPFFGGVFLESELVTSRRMFDFVFKMFASGDATLPEKGMGQLAIQMASRLPPDSITFDCNVKSITNNSVTLDTGETINGQRIVLATDQGSAHQLLNLNPPKSAGVTCMYFAAQSSPLNEPILVLNGDQTDGPINNLCVPSDVAASYAPAGASLISVTILGANHDQEQLKTRVLNQAKSWYGDTVDKWQFLKTYQIRHALPRQDCIDLEPVQKSFTSSSGIYRCGDYLDYASIQGALSTGRKLAEQLC